MEEEEEEEIDSFLFSRIPLCQQEQFYRTQT
jgi:hypothetical protein